MKHTIIITLLTLSLFIMACQSSSTDTNETVSNLIEISKTQFKSEQMEMSAPERIGFNNKLHFTGSVVPAPNGHAIISAPIAGTIKNIKVVTGQHVPKGTTLLTVSGHAIIDLQKDYAESLATLQRLKIDYERIKALYKENIGTKKDFTLIQSNYKVELAKSNALKMKLESAGLSADKIAEGSFSETYALKAPISGYVSRIDASVGQFVEPLAVLSQIIDAASFRLSIPIFGRDINKLVTGQIVEFYSGNNQNEILHATINSIGKSVDPTSKAIVCFAQIHDRSNLVSHQFVEGDIFLSSDTSLAVPTSAILKAENAHFVLVLKKETEEAYFYKKTKVITGRENTDYTELLNNEPENKQVLNGVYHIKVE
ncbi:RND family efflux transporter, MFP subunit [Saccharicrinis carchari]|uniref:RND family efflux transporter, MFP subunit n=1 Tax=Saccharicrinis carchari TaxID=1168039 RepID=A0A521D5I3_SACCC|nr:efflux RND transporter periplasmic adaptor subunit [Saccharicrinis carchari]SMO66954.1 RND family efflux transporter, MFP subunit [Saccharicrinis carchari]